MRAGPFHLVIAVVSLAAIGSPAASAGDTLRFQAIPTSAYVYRPSPEGPGENCAPSRFLCEYKVAGSFDYTWDRTSGVAKLTNVNLQLIGNEGEKISTMATSTGISDWLKERTFVDQHVLGPFTHFADQTYSQLILVDSYDGYLDLRGGFDNTPADGIGVDFHFRAKQVPEPTGLAGLVAVPFAFVVLRRFRDRLRRRHSHARSGKIPRK